MPQRGRPCARRCAPAPSTQGSLCGGPTWTCYIALALALALAVACGYAVQERRGPSGSRARAAVVRPARRRRSRGRGPTLRRRRRGLQGDADRKKVLDFAAVGAEAGGSQPGAPRAGTCWKNRPKQAGPSKVMCCGGSIRPTAATRWVVADPRKRAARRGARWLRRPRHTPGPAISDTSSCASLATLVARACADRPTRRRQRKTARRQRSRLRLRLQRQIPRRSLRHSSFICSAIHLASSCFSLWAISLWAISLWAMAIISVGGRLRAQRHVKNPKATVPRPQIGPSTMKPSASSHPPSF